MVKLIQVAREAAGYSEPRLPDLPILNRAAIPHSAPTRVGSLLDSLLTDADPQWAYVRSDGSLLLDLRPQMDAILRVTSWADGLRTSRLVEGRWVEEWHDWQLAFVREALLRDDHPARPVALTVPKDAADLAAAAGGYEITALRLLRRDPQAWDFARSAPNLFWLICGHLGALNRPVDSDSALFKMPRMALLRMCTGAVASEAAVRFVERFRPNSRSDHELHLLRMSVRPAVVNLMRRCSLFGPSTLLHATQVAGEEPLFVADALRLCCATLVEHDAVPGKHDDALRDAYKLYDDALDLARALGLDVHEGEALLRRLPSVKRLRALHDRWTSRLNAQFPERARQRLLDPDPLSFGDDDAADNEALPDSGLAETRDIQAIRTVGEVRAEGHEMEHCAGAYVDRCRRGESFIFRVLRPSRATLEVRLREGRPAVAQLKGPRNSEAPPETTASVERWLDGHRKRSP